MDDYTKCKTLFNILKTSPTKKDKIYNEFDTFCLDLPKRCNILFSIIIQNCKSNNDSNCNKISKIFHKKCV